MSTSRRDYQIPATDAIMAWWLGGFGYQMTPERREALLEWWSVDGYDAALEAVHVVCQAISDAGFDIVKREI